MNKRKGERWGWIGGWLGAFLWLLILSIILLVQGRINSGISGLALFAVAVLLIIKLSPWKHPETKYWKLMLPIYAVFAVSACLTVWSMGDLGSTGLDWWTLVYMLPILIPFATVGSRRWNDVK